MNESSVRNEIVEIGKRMYTKNFVASNDGNLSVRISENEIIITPSGVSKGFLKAEDMLVVDMDGKVLSGSMKPSSEMKMHLAVYRIRPDVFGVCHAHPQIATAFAVARKVCDKIALPEAIFTIGRVVLSEYATPTTTGVADSIEEVIKTANAILLANHGALTVGATLMDAYYKMETLEHYAAIIMYARLLGGEVGLSRQEVGELLKVRRDVFGKPDIDLSDDGFCGGSTLKKADEQEELIKSITSAIIERIKGA